MPGRRVDVGHGLDDGARPQKLVGHPAILCLNAEYVAQSLLVLEQHLLLFGDQLTLQPQPGVTRKGVQ